MVNVPNDKWKHELSIRAGTLPFHLYTMNQKSHVAKPKFREHSAQGDSGRATESLGKNEYRDRSRIGVNNAITHNSSKTNKRSDLESTFKHSREDQKGRVYEEGCPSRRKVEDLSGKRRGLLPPTSLLPQASSKPLRNCSSLPLSEPLTELAQLQATDSGFLLKSCKENPCKADDVQHHQSDPSVCIWVI